MIEAIILAACLSHNPLDLRCVPADFVYPTQGFYMQNPAERHQMLMLCTSPYVTQRPPRGMCQAAATAQHYVTGGNY